MIKQRIHALSFIRLLKAFALIYLLNLKLLLFNGSWGDPTPYFKHNWLYEFKLFKSTLFITVSGRIFDAH